ncbi:Elongation of very long chain fatty acids protein [Operophtera brumata]|uniref:Elongation of very long chain fatty acids protein n=1 Tax=Operophtera brumata TaxID=104452 RepID=A0A0L7L2D6_OPEBR|nr:Elongation of very long chain fatty acids protein [Operophtera brumata]
MALVLQYLNNMQVYWDKYGAKWFMQNYLQYPYNLTIPDVDRIIKLYLFISDPRTNPWFLMSSPLPTLLICASYVYLVKVAGPKFMENRKPLEFKKLLIFYNAVQVVFSAWLFYELAFCLTKTKNILMCHAQSLMGGWLNHYSYRCQPVDYSDSPMAKRMVNVCWWYYFSKFTEFFDTAQFIGIMVHAFQLLFIDCDYPRAFVWWIGMHAVMFFFLFKDFYNQSYSSRSRQKVRAKSPQPETTEISYKNGSLKNGFSNGHGTGVLRARTVLPAGN